MPCYTYLCNSCSKKFEIVCSIANYKEKTSCEFCKSKNTERCYIEDLLTLNTSVRLADSELKTIGHLANRNNEKFSDDQKIALYKKHNEYKEQTSQKELPSGMTRMKKTKGKTKWTKD
jgi:putative FmdB family regulatory protein